MEYMGRRRDPKFAHLPERTRYVGYSYPKLPPNTPIETPNFEELGLDDDSIRKALSQPIEPRWSKTKTEEVDNNPYEEKTTPFGVRITRHKATRALLIEKDDLKLWIFPILSPEEIKASNEDIDEDGYGRTIVNRMHRVMKIKMVQRPKVIRLAWNQEMVFMRGNEERIPEEQRGLFGYQEHIGRFPPKVPCGDWRQWGQRERFPEQFKYIVALCIKYKIPSRHVSDILGIRPESMYQIARNAGLTFDYAGKFEHIRQCQRRQTGKSRGRKPGHAPKSSK